MQTGSKIIFEQAHNVLSKVERVEIKIKNQIQLSHESRVKTQMAAYYMDVVVINETGDDQERYADA